ncbi:hypothetical protein FOMA001_g18040 [Fusarium oxysporum f. sp. matthiolae]|nr:hypothetical protein FOMA001_g18040 [Fusarium oxysporum f. sp. matthiolae]
MESPPILDEIRVINPYDDKSFLDERHSHRIWPNDSTRAAVFPAEEDRGTTFQPFQVEPRKFHINTLPPTPLKLFQLFLPIFLVEKWVVYTKSWVTWLKKNGWIDSWKTEMKSTSKLHKWEGPTTSEVMIMIGVLIYIGVHKEKKIRSYWEGPKPGVQRAEHSFVKFISYDTFQLIHRHLRPFDHTKIDETAPLPRVFQGVEEWSDHIQAVSMQLFRPGSHLAVDECIIRYTGKSDSITTIKGKPDPVGFKIWVVAQMGFFIKWLWHIKEEEYGAVGVEISTQELSSQPSQARPRKRRKVSAKAAKKSPDTGGNDDAVNSTQAVVVGLTRTLPKSAYHVFVDNLFSSTPLFRNLRKQGYGATGTARTNSGIHEELVRDKNDDGKVKKMYEFNAIKVIPTPDNQVLTSDTLG